MEEKKPEQTKKPNSKCWWFVGGCGCLIIIVIVVLFGLRFVTGFNIIDIFSNQPSGSNTPKDEEDIELSKANLIDYFVEETTIYPGLNQPAKVIRWEKELVFLSIADTPPEGAIKAIDDFINIFNRNSSKTKLSRVNSSGDIIFYFQADTRGAAGSSGPSTGADYIIDHANIKLSEDAALFQQSMESVLSHEIFHALGFTGHYSGNVCRLMSSSVCGSHLTINEERLIQMLYATEISSGADENQIREYFKNWSPK